MINYRLNIIILFLYGIVLCFSSIYGCQSDSIEEVIMDEEKAALTVTDLKITIRKILPVKEGEAEIELLFISFNTEKYSFVTLKNGDNEFNSEGISHSFMTIIDNDFEYSIIIDGEFADIININKFMGTAEECNMFSYVGDIWPFLTSLIPIMNDIYNNLGSYCGDLNIYFLGGVDYNKIFDKKSIFTLQEKTPEEMFASLQAKYDEHKAELLNIWPVFSEDELMPVFILNTVARLWHFGNFIYPHASGCVRVNETISPEEGDYIFEYAHDSTPIYYKHAEDMSDYLNSKIGCCTDHAFITKILLDKADYLARRLVSPGHWFAETVVDGNWYTIDASFGSLVKSSIEDMKSNVKRTAYIFILPYMEENHPLIYPTYAKYTISLGLKIPITDEYIYIYDFLPGELPTFN